MSALRPSVAKGDGYIQKVIRYIPVEIVAGYTAMVGYLYVAPGSAIPEYYKTYYCVFVLILLAITPVWTYYAVLDSEKTPDSDEKMKRALFHAFIAFFSFMVWVYGMDNPILSDILGEALYSSPLSSIILVLFTILTPLIERIVLGTPLPGKQ